MVGSNLINLFCLSAGDDMILSLVQVFGTVFMFIVMSHSAVLFACILVQMMCFPCCENPKTVQEFSEWAQCQVLEFAAQYQPKDEDEVFGIMNVLDDRLSHSNTAVVMGCVKLFLHLTLKLPATHQQVCCVTASR